MERKPLYKKGDMLRIVNYGSLISQSKHAQVSLNLPVIREDDHVIYYDLQPELVGQKGIVTSVMLTQGIPHYSLEGIKGKSAWYVESQLKLVDHV